MEKHPSQAVLARWSSMQEMFTGFAEKFTFMGHDGLALSSQALAEAFAAAPHTPEALQNPELEEHWLAVRTFLSKRVRIH